MMGPSLGGTITVVQLHLGRVEVFVAGYGGALIVIFEEMLEPFITVIFVVLIVLGVDVLVSVGCGIGLKGSFGPMALMP